jgi:hypothetical protein
MIREWEGLGTALRISKRGEEALDKPLNLWPKIPRDSCPLSAAGYIAPPAAMNYHQSLDLLLLQ